MIVPTGTPSFTRRLNVHDRARVRRQRALARVGSGGVRSVELT
jgi:hypothetical protein